MAEWEADVGWIGVDADGHVAVFHANECGAVPRAVDLSVDLDELLHALRVASGDVDRDGADPDGARPDGADLDDEESEGAEGEIPSGVYWYWHDGGYLARPYEREDAPEAPLSAAALPPELVARMVAFEGRFADHLQLQPAEHWACTAPGACWLATDQQTIRCIAGRERAFAADAAAVEAAFPGEYAIVAPARRRWWQFWAPR